MITKQLVKTYYAKKCPYLIWIFSNEKRVLKCYQELMEKGFSLKEITQENYNSFLDIIKDNKELITHLLSSTKQDDVSKIIIEMENLQEISLLSMKYFSFKYSNNIKRADTIDGTLNGKILSNQEKIKENTQKYLKDDNIKVILEGQIDVQNYRARWDALVKNEDNTYTIYEVKGTTNVLSSKEKIKDNYRLDIMFQYFVYQKIFKEKIDNIVLVKLNQDFSFSSDLKYPLDDERIVNLFEEVAYLGEIKLKDYIQNNIEEIESLVREIETIIKGIQPFQKMKYQCRKDEKCLFFEECLANNNYPSIDNIFQLTTATSLGGNWRLSQELIDNMNCISIQDIPPYYIDENFPYRKGEKNNVARLQIETCLNPNTEEFIDKEGIKILLAEEYSCFPLVFFDFETFQYPFPLVLDQHPWEQICSQYSMHILEKDYDLKNHDYKSGKGGGITHFEFLGDPAKDLSKNPEPLLIETMLKQFQQQKINWQEKQFTLIVYNKSFECTQFERMARKYPCYAKFLNICKERTVDLMDFFTKGLWYKKEYKGKVSLKVISPNMQKDEKIMQQYQNLLFDIKDTLDYHTESDLIHNGSIALDIYQSLLRASLKKISFPQYKEIRQGLLKYCKKDSWGTVIIYDILKRKADDIEN